MIKKYKKKPLLVEAMQYSGSEESRHEIVDFCQGSKTPAFINYHKLLKIISLDTIMSVSAGDYVIKGIDGEFYTCKPDIFSKIYERV